MGYTSRTVGAITITPPLTWNEYKDSPFRETRGQNGYRDAVLHMDYATPISDAPEPHQGGGPELVATELRGYEGDYRCYYLEEHLAEFVAAFGADHTFGGCLIRRGESQGDMERYTIVNGEMVTEKARLTWPDGEKVTEQDRGR